MVASLAYRHLVPSARLRPAAPRAARLTSHAHDVSQRPERGGHFGITWPTRPARLVASLFTTMETHLAAIHASLDQLHALHARISESSSRPSYFTNAVLNPGRVDILELIRDADAFEASLFVAPTKGERTGAPEAPKPALRPVAVPTPLKQPRTEPSDARTYLLAAEKLLQNYHNAPRARKHIRMLLRREGELQRHITRYQATIEQASKAQAQQTSTSSSGPAPHEASSPTRAPRVDAAEWQRIKEEIQRERMEILALESLLHEHEASAAQRKAAAPEASPMRAPTTPAKASAPTPARTTPDTRLRSTPGPSGTPRRALASSVSRAETPTTTPRRAALRASTSQVPREGCAPSTPRRTTPARPSPAAPPTSTPRRTPTTRPLSQSVSGTPTQGGTPRRALPRTSPAGTAALVPMGTVPPATDALERVAAHVWERFGEPLRYARPGCASASFSDTFQALRQLEQGVPHEEGAPDSYGSAPNPSGPLSVSVAMMAHVMLLLLRAPAPHTLTLPTIKALSETWWRQQGQAALQAAMRAPTSCSALVQQVGLDPTDVEQAGDALATRAVYGLVAKKVLRIQRAGGAPSVGFA